MLCSLFNILIMFRRFAIAEALAVNALLASVLPLSFTSCTAFLSSSINLCLSMIISPCPTAIRAVVCVNVNLLISKIFG